MDTVSTRIAAVLEARKLQLPAVEREVAYWNAVQRLVNDLDDAVRQLSDEDADTGVLSEIARLDVAELTRLITETLAALAAVRARVSRKTINIGVSGRARNGKSTLLQSLSGLGDQQIPTGRGQAVTATRSSIYHSLSRSEAVLLMHSEGSFCTEVVAPYYRVLELGTPPQTVGEFAAEVYPSSADELPGGAAAQPKSGPMLTRLREMQQALPLYRPLLTGLPRTVELADLRRWVAYPASGDQDPAPERRYLAVQHASIFCAFPLEDVIDLGLVDLPGLGELVPQAEERHLAGLTNEVDFVLVVKRPTDTNAMWSAEDGTALKLIGLASGAASMRDFMAILVNSGECLEVNVEALHADLSKRLNEGLDDPPYRIITADAADRDIVRDQVLSRVLEDLSLALPRMDAAVIRHAMTLGAAAREHLLGTVTGLLASLRSVMVPTPTQELIEKATALRTEAASSLQEWVGQLRERADGDYEDTEFYARIAQIQAAARDWIKDGFGEGPDGWTERALGAMRVNRSSASFAERALNDIRVEISRRFALIDDVLLRRRHEFWAALIEGLGPRLGQLVEHDDPEQALHGLAGRLRDAPDPCPALAETVDLVLDVRLDYRTRVLPQVRRSLDVLLPHPGKGRRSELAGLLDVPLTAEGAKELYTAISGLAREAVHEAGTVLSQEPGITALVLFAYGEQFEDSFIRSDVSEAGFLALSEAFRDQLWPAGTPGPALSTVRVQRVKTVLTQLRAALDEKMASAGGVA